VKVKKQIQKVQRFHDDLEIHYYLWGKSLQQPLPDYPVRNIQELQKQTNHLARQLGTLRSYIEQLVQSTIMSAAGRHWDAYDSAVSNDVATVKRPSMRG
jgi:hypothetical protein